MPKKQCPNGHVYDPSIYGDQCPLCPPPGTSGAAANSTAVNGPATHLGNSAASAAPNADGHTHVATPKSAPIPSSHPDVSGETQFRPQSAEPRGGAGGHTVIRRAGQSGPAPKAESARVLVGFLVTYNRTPEGRAYNIYEGRNYIGRDNSCDIAVPGDNQMSGRHLSILFRNVDRKFKFRDEQSSNGTFINGELLDDGELNNYDIIRAGSTIFIFIAIPNIN